MKYRLLALGLALASQWPMAKAASFLEVVNGTAQRSTTAGTAIVGPGADVIVGSLRLNLDAGQRASITYTYLGGDGDQPLRFQGPGAWTQIDSRAAHGTLLTTQVAAGLLDFGFADPGGRTRGSTANYGWNASHVGIVLEHGGRSGWLMFEDGRGLRGPDLDYDDMVMRFELNVAPVPEPGVAALMAAGLGLLGAVGAARARRRTA